MQSCSGQNEAALEAQQETPKASSYEPKGNRPGFMAPKTT